jgi:hypothetical protein
MKKASNILFLLSFLWLVALAMRPIAVIVHERMRHGPVWLAWWIKLPALPPPCTLNNIMSLVVIITGIIASVVLFARADRRRKQKERSEV